MANHTLIRGVLSITIGKAKHLGHEKTLLSKVTSVITCSTHVPMVDNSGTYVKVYHEVFSYQSLGVIQHSNGQKTHFIIYDINLYIKLPAICKIHMYAILVFAHQSLAIICIKDYKLICIGVQ